MLKLSFSFVVDIKIMCAVLSTAVLIILPCDAATKSLPYLIPLDFYWDRLRLCNKSVLMWQMAGIKEGSCYSLSGGLPSLGEGFISEYSCKNT